ncbi:hypothetical protein Tco_0036120, partial [Tanacetum coccineum]
YMIITEFDYTQELTDEVGELRAIFGHMLRAAGVQIPENNLDNLHSSREEDGTLETMDPQDLLGSLSLADIDLIIVKLLTRTLVLDFLGCEPLALVDSFTPVEDNIWFKMSVEDSMQIIKEDHFRETMQEEML